MDSYYGIDFAKTPLVTRSRDCARPMHFGSRGPRKFLVSTRVVFTLEPKIDKLRNISRQVNFNYFK